MIWVLAYLLVGLLVESATWVHIARDDPRYHTGWATLGTLLWPVTILALLVWPIARPRLR